MNNAMTSFSLLALACSLALGAALLPNEAAATVYRDTSAGGACKPAFGASNKFVFNNNYLENIGTTDQYVVCHFAMDELYAADPESAERLIAYFKAGSAGGTATCQAQYGFHWHSNDISSSVVVTLPLGAGVSGFMEWDVSLFYRDSIYDTLTMSCKVPGSWRLGLISYRTVA